MIPCGSQQRSNVVCDEPLFTANIEVWSGTVDGLAVALTASRGQEWTGKLPIQNRPLRLIAHPYEQGLRQHPGDALIGTFLSAGHFSVS